MPLVRRLAIGTLVLAALIVGAGALGLALAHHEIRGLDPPLPDPGSLGSIARQEAKLAVGIYVVNTASQPMPRSAVLDPARDPRPDAPYVMSHPAFALEWPDGRLLLIDAGMGPGDARAFGRPIEWMAGASAIEPHGSSAAQLGDAVRRVRGLVFTHLHADHTSGATELCTAPQRAPVQLFQSATQTTRRNWTTRLGAAPLSDAACLEPLTLPASPLMRLPGFPGVAVIHAAGHTPGSQLVVAWVNGRDGLRGYVFAGDVANQIDGIRFGVPKPFLYRLLVVPESEGRLARVRRFLRQLEREREFRILVSHDLKSIEAAGVPPWRERGRHSELAHRALSG